MSDSNIQVSSGSSKSNLVTSDTSEYWQSNGSKPHWIQITVPSGSSYPSLQHYVIDHESYSPKDLSVYVGTSASSLSKVKDMELSKSGGWTTLLSSSEMRSSSSSSSPQVLKIEIRSNHDSGCDSRVSGIRLLSGSDSSSGSSSESSKVLYVQPS